jgi:hypothetical protein
MLLCLSSLSKFKLRKNSGIVNKLGAVLNNFLDYDANHTTKIKLIHFMIKTLSYNF